MKRLSCPWCPDDKTCFKSGKSLKFRGHFEDDHEFKCSKCGYICGISKVEGHLNTCRGTRLLQIITVLLVLTFEIISFKEYLDHGKICKSQIDKARPDWDPSDLKSNSPKPQERFHVYSLIWGLL